MGCRWSGGWRCGWGASACDVRAPHAALGTLAHRIADWIATNVDFAYLVQASCSQDGGPAGMANTQGNPARLRLEVAAIQVGTGVKKNGMRLVKKQFRVIADHHTSPWFWALGAASSGWSLKKACLITPVGFAPAQPGRGRATALAAAPDSAGGLSTRHASQRLAHRQRQRPAETGRCY